MAKIIDSGSVLNLEHQKKYVKSPDSWAAYMADLAVWFKEDEHNPKKLFDTFYWGYGSIGKNSTFKDLGVSTPGYSFGKGVRSTDVLTEKGIVWWRAACAMHKSQVATQCRHYLNMGEFVGEGVVALAIKDVLTSEKFSEEHAVRDTIIAYVKRCPHVLDDEVLAKSVIQGHLDAPLDLSRTGLHHVVKHLQARLQVL